ncbi:MAG TPA: type I DNA topoisomerase [Longimicrobiales bacterium]|nr:type I DNA topoisomerase [Longimicrobiales bacterium]
MADKTKEKRLVVVESPAKAKTIGKYLGPNYKVRASVGHVRDLPERELGVDVDNGFEPKYVTIRGKGKIIQDLRKDAELVGEVLLATDPDREGEAIAYHVAEQLGYEKSKKAKARFKRVLFHEITRDAVRRALEHPGEIDMRKVEAQQARRILDRLVGYQASPILWKPIRPGLSAGRVQTVALRLIVEREEEIRAFTAEEYWSVTAQLERAGKQFEAKLHHIDGKAFRLENQDSAAAVLAAVDDVPFVITEIKRRERVKNPPAPFTTSTLQQEAAKRLGFSAQRTMRIAQQLYEGVEVGAEGSVGLITYMRTDSTRVAASAAEQAQSWVEEQFGRKYLPGSVRLWGGKQQKGAQEAHEAIRPTDVEKRPDRLKQYLDRDQLRLYELIWMRFVAGQMAPAIYDTTTVDFDLQGADGHSYLFRATGSIVKFDGFTRLYQEAREEGDHRTLDDLTPLPALEEKMRCELLGILPAQHFTQPPPRFTEASLVKELERLGIGRPSTYAAIISTLVDRTYVEFEQKKFAPTVLGETVAKVLVKVFPDIFNVSFTSGMETELDKIEEGDLDWRTVLEDFYTPFKKQLKQGEKSGDALVRETVSSETKNCPTCGKPMLVRWNRFGRFLGCSGYPECKTTETLDKRERAEPKPLGIPCPLDGGELVEREGRYGAFIACSNYPTCKYTQPKTIPGLKCPKCGEGEIGEKRTRKGKPFWGCTRYPECDWSSWDRPTAGPCPNCKSPLLVEKKTKARGEFIKCPQCNNEYTRDESGNLELAALASSPDAAPPIRKPFAKKSAPVKKLAVKKTAIRKSAPASTNGASAAKQTAPAKKAAPAKLAASAKKAASVKKAASAKKAAPTRKTAPVKKTAAKKAVVKKASAKKTAAKKAAPRKAAGRK